MTQEAKPIMARRDGNVSLLKPWVTALTIQAQGSLLSAIRGPDGDRTTLSTNGEGLLSAVTNPANETTSFEYAPGGLLSAVTGARGNLFKPALRALEQASR